MNYLNEIKVTYKRDSKKDYPKLHSSKECYSFFLQLFNLDTIDLKEELYMILLNRNLKPIGFLRISEGGYAGTTADVKYIMGTALKCAAHGIVIAHNHPSGNLKPSETDIKLATKIKDAAKLLDMTLIDNLIITSDNYFSFADNGLI